MPPRDLTGKKIVRVEFEYEDGEIQTLRGGAAEAWMENVNGIIGLAQIRYGQSQMKDHPWEWTHKDDE